MARKNNIFTQVPVKTPKRNHFDLSHEVKMSCKMGFLYPILLKDCLPGDYFTNTSTIMSRFAPMLAPIYHRIDVTTHYFFVPDRLLWDNWEEFITGGQDGEATPVKPYTTVALLGGLDPTLFSKGTLWDYFGLPTYNGSVPSSWSGARIGLEPFKAYAKVWNDYYRDPNFDDEIDLFTELDGAVPVNTAVSVMALKRRGWERDYFTSALPFAQRGIEVLMPISATGTVEYADTSYLIGTAAVPDGSANIGAGLSGTIKTLQDDNGQPLRIENIESVAVNNSQVAMNDFRRALAIQTWLETNARGGARYTEQILAHFGTRVPDYRLQRAEYLGGGKQAVKISEVVSTANTEVSAVEQPLGDLAGHGISVGNTNRFSYRCQEHGWIIGIMSILPRTAYQQGIDRMWTREDKFDYAWTELAHIGEQEIINRELFFSFDADDDSDNVGTFGYIPRFSEYKFMNDRVAGDFRDDLSYWHEGRIFTSRPSLNEDFTTMDEDGYNEALEQSYRRIFAVQDGSDYIWTQIYHRLHAKRPLPYFGVPKIQ